MSTSLNERQRQLIYHSMDIFVKKSNSVETMAIFYDIFFHEYPQYQKYFDRWRGVDQNDLRCFIYCDFYVHDLGNKVMEMMENLVLILDNKNLLSKWIDELLSIPKHRQLKLKSDDYFASFATFFLNFFENLI